MSARRQSFLLFLLGLGMSVFLPANVGGQETPQLIPVTVEVSNQPLGPIFLRPQALTTVGFTLKNATADDMRGIVVKLVDVANNNNILVQKDIARIAAKSDARVVFAKAKEEKKDKEKDKDTGEKIELTGTPSFKLQLWIETQDPKDLVVKRDIDVFIREPRDYVKSKALFDAVQRKLSFTLNYLDFKNLTGPHQCPVQMILGPELKETKKGTYKQLLTNEEPVTLFADNPAFVDLNLREGRVHLTVDGYERAFTYPVTLAGDGTLDVVPLGRTIGARILAPRYAKPSAKFPVALELDGPLAGDYRVEVGIDRGGMKEQFQVVKLPGLRQQKVRLSYAPSGDLYFQADVRDWQTEFDTTGIFGNFWLRVSVYKNDQLVELTIPKEVRPTFADQEPGTDSEAKRLFARVIQDSSEPEGVAFVDLPKEWRLGKPLLIQAKITKREEHQAPIDKVVFFKGKAAPDGKVDPDAILGVTEFDAKRSEALFELPAQDAVGPLQLSVQFTTKTGVHGAKTGMVNFKDFAGKGICKIKGNLSHGPLGQVGRAVSLSDAGGKVKDVVKTDAKGDYVFDKVPPGTYTISSQVNYPALVGATVVQVPEGIELIEGEKAAVKLKAK